MEHVNANILVKNVQCNIRLLGGLISAHLLASKSSGDLMPGGYKSQLLQLADDLGQRLLPAFNTPTGIPYAWVNLKVSFLSTLTCPICL